jgi:hypothetical protein
MKEQWFIDWLKENEFSFWYEYNGNEVWVNTKYTLVWRLGDGVRFQIANEDYSEEYIQSLL